MQAQIGAADLGQLHAGAWVRLVRVPSWLIRDLPPDDAARVQACLGQRMRVTEVDAHGCIWLGADAQSAGWFCVQPADVEVGLS